MVWLWWFSLSQNGQGSKREGRRQGKEVTEKRKRKRKGERQRERERNRNILKS